jgi:hypothetical protein
MAKFFLLVWPKFSNLYAAEIFLKEITPQERQETVWISPSASNDRTKNQNKEADQNTAEA